jgi:hypothetical protein
MKTILYHTAEIYVLATAIAFSVAALIKFIERAVRPRPAPLSPRTGS